MGRSLRARAAAATERAAEPAAPEAEAVTAIPLQPPPAAAPADDAAGPLASFGWSSRAQQPIVLRVPRGLAVVAAAVFLGLIVAAYWAGSSRGYDRGLRAGAVLPAPRASLFTQQPTQPTAAAPPTRGGDHIARGAAKRREGYYYFILAHLPEDNARKLVDFLRVHGVAADVSRRNNAGHYPVVALRGFPSRTSEEIAEYEAELRRLGRLWKAEHRGAGDLGDMYLSQF